MGRLWGCRGTEKALRGARAHVVTYPCLFIPVVTFLRVVPLFGRMG